MAHLFWDFASAIALWDKLVRQWTGNEPLVSEQNNSSQRVPADGFRITGKRPIPFGREFGTFF
uniref:RxLR effector candidate protein n=1 Tax=Hyaloperonospora arabidopsidis (strain Emoy2) TaxID=559515 RepID=M4C6U8_HYAAE